jgi:hypothetical protein
MIKDLCLYKIHLLSMAKQGGCPLFGKIKDYSQVLPEPQVKLRSKGCKLLIIRYL